MKRNDPHYVFFGTPRFAHIALAHLIQSGYPPIAVVCNPDRPVGRKKVITPPPVKTLAIEKNIKVLQPETFDATVLEQLKKYDTDLFVVAAYAKILKKDVIDIPLFGTIGIHPSLLPRLRGATPIQSTILLQENPGTTIFYIDEGIDHGPIISQKRCDECDIYVDIYVDLEEKLAHLGAKLLVTAFENWNNAPLIAKEQSHDDATLTSMFSSQDGYVDIEMIRSAQDNDIELAQKIDRLIRAIGHEPGVYTLDENGKRIKLLNSNVENGKLVITKIQKEGKTPIEKTKGFIL